MTSYQVAQGDCIYSIAAKAGFLWTTIWNDPANANLRSQRKNPNLLAPGDTVVIPDKVPKQVPKPTDATHVFKVKGIPASLNLQMLDKNHQPRAGLSYTVSIDGDLRHGTLDAQGKLKQPILATAQKAVLILTDQGHTEQYEVNLGHVNPRDDDTGVQQRLTNLGMSDGLPQKVALQLFQKKNGLPETGEVDNATRDFLTKVHGC